MPEQDSKETFREAAMKWLRCYDQCAASARHGQGSIGKHKELLAALETLKNEVGIARGYPSFRSRRNTATVRIFVHGIAATIVSVAGTRSPTMQQE